MASHDPTAEALVPRAKPRRTVVVLAAAVVSGIAGYLVLVLTARHLDAAENADFLVFWAALFSVFGVLVGIASETTRAVFAGESEATRRAACAWFRWSPPSASPRRWCWASRGCGGGATSSATAGPTCCPCCWWVSCCSPCTAGSAALSRAVRSGTATRRWWPLSPRCACSPSQWSPSSAPPSSGSLLPAPSRPAPGCSSCWSRQGAGGRCLPGPTSAWARTWPASSAPARRPPPPPCCWWASRCC